MAKVLTDFRDRETWRLWHAGEEYDGPRAAELETLGLLGKGGATDLSKLTNPELKALADERGIDVPKKATKAQLIALLEE